MTPARRTKSLVVSVVGARPQLVKLAPLERRLRRRFRHLIFFSGQHYDHNLSDVFFEQLRLPRPEVNFRIGSDTQGSQTARILAACEKYLTAYRPDLVLVYGDTNTTLAGALAAAKLEIPVGHIEAGLRSGRPQMAEEINRRLTDHLSSLLFYPTLAARRHLEMEGINRGLVKSGDLMYELLADCNRYLSRLKNFPSRFGLRGGRYLFLTLHRAENVDHRPRLEKFIAFVKALDYPIVFPMHPRTAKNLKRFRLFDRLRAKKGLNIIEPLPYLQSIALMDNAAAVLTDSGGIQKEAAFLGRPCLTLRTETEWLETLEGGGNSLIDFDSARALQILSRLPRLRPHRSFRINNRRPSEIITAAVASYLGKGR